MSFGDFPTLGPIGQEPKITNLFKDFTSEALGQLIHYLGLHVQVPITQVLGFSQYAPQRAFVAASQATGSTSYTNLATTGPSITGLPDGQYLAIVGAVMKNDTSGQLSLMSVAPNATTALDTD